MALHAFPIYTGSETRSQPDAAYVLAVFKISVTVIGNHHLSPIEASFGTSLQSCFFSILLSVTWLPSGMCSLLCFELLPLKGCPYMYLGVKCRHLEFAPAISLAACLSAQPVTAFFQTSMISHLFQLLCHPMLPSLFYF